LKVQTCIQSGRTTGQMPENERKAHPSLHSG
jgi:hypothetical protein